MAANLHSRMDALLIHLIYWGFLSDFDLSDLVSSCVYFSFGDFLSSKMLFVNATCIACVYFQKGTVPLEMSSMQN